MWGWGGGGGGMTGRAWWIAGMRASPFDVHTSQSETRNALGQRTGSPARPNELQRTRKTFGSSKMRTLEFPLIYSTLGSPCAVVFIGSERERETEREAQGEK